MASHIKKGDSLVVLHAETYGRSCKTLCTVESSNYHSCVPNNLLIMLLELIIIKTMHSTHPKLLNALTCLGPPQMYSAW